jgi:hypothetical protein
MNSKMSNKIILTVLLGIFFTLVISNTADASLFNSKDLTLSLDQKEYYFKTGENAVISLNADNTYGDTIDGFLSYTITQSLQQGSFQYSSSSTKSTSFSIEDGESTIPLNFGASDTPITLSVNMKFSYTKDKEREVVIEGLKIYFVSEDSQKNNQQNKVSSSSQEAQASQQQNDPLTEQEQRMQQNQNTQQSLQNNQMNQDSSALKEQMQKQLQEQQQMKDEFQKQLAQNEEFQQEHQSLLSQGYNPVSANLNPTSNNTGSFELNYENQNGEQASLKGQMENGDMQSMQKDTAESRQQMLDQLQQNKEFQKYQKQLQDQGFKQQNAEFSQQENKTSVQLNYINKNNETAMIKADILNNTVKNIELVNNTKKNNKNYWWILLVLSLCTLLGYFAYKKFSAKAQKNPIAEDKAAEKYFDYKAEALSMLEKAKKLFDENKYKDAYGLSGQALRLYLSYENNLKKEVTNDEIAAYLRKHNKASKEAKECFDLCSLVEFAKYQANKEDFDKIMGYATKVIK